LMQDHPCLTQADIQACSLFAYLRIIGKLWLSFILSVQRFFT
jgi:hypothetical protein